MFIVLSCIIFGENKCNKLFSIVNTPNVVNILWTQHTFIASYNQVSNEKMISSSINPLVLEKIQVATFGACTLLGWTVKLGQAKILQQLLDNGLSISFPVDMIGSTALHVAAINNVESVIEVILKYDISLLESEDSQGYTAVMLCAKYDSMQVLKKLIPFNANIRKGLNAKFSSWILAYYYRQKKITNSVADIEDELFLDYLDSIDSKSLE